MPALPKVLDRLTCEQQGCCLRHWRDHRLCSHPRHRCRSSVPETRVNGVPYAGITAPEGAASGSEFRCYVGLRRRPSQPSPTSADPRMVRDAGSGTVLLLKLIVRLKLHGAAPVQPSGAVIVYRAVSEKGAGSSAKGVLLKGPSARIAVNVSVDRISAAACVNSPLAGSFSVVSTTVKPAGELVPGLTLIEVR